MPAGDVRPIADPGLGNTSYVIDLGGGRAAALDPPRNIGAHLSLAGDMRLRIVASIETHLHADFISGSRELAALGAEVVASADAQLAFPHRAVRGGETIGLGDLEFRVLATPGHTPEHVSYAFDGAVFSGGSLISSGAARTDLIAPEHTEPLARAQFHSLHTIAGLPPETTLHPTHGAGSFCSATPTRSRATTIGDERRTNPLLTIATEDEFVRQLVGGYGSFPPYFLELRPLNRAGPELLEELDTPKELDPAEARAHLEDGVPLVDCRPLDVWAAGHALGSVANALRDPFASWLGWIVPFGAPFMLLAERHQLDEAVRQARLIGYDSIAGWLTFEAWQRAGGPVAAVDLLSPQRAHERGARVLDVRQDAEVEAGSPPGAEHIELGDVIAGKTPQAAEVVTMCAHGQRAATAASLLERRGIPVAVVSGGFSDWEKAGLPVER